MGIHRAESSLIFSSQIMRGLCFLYLKYAGQLYLPYNTGSSSSVPRGDTDGWDGGRKAQREGTHGYYS